MKILLNDIKFRRTAKCSILSWQGTLQYLFYFALEKVLSNILGPSNGYLNRLWTKVSTYNPIDTNYCNYY